MSKMVFAAAAMTAATVFAADASAATFNNGGQIVIPDTGSSGPSNPYPSIINVSGLSGAVTDVNVTFHGLSHTWSGDLEIALHGPTGQRVALLADFGGGLNWTNDDVTFSDGAGLPVVGSSGTYRTAVNTCENASICDGASDLLSAFNGLDPNGNWSLYVFDDAGGDRGRIAGGWSLDITTDAVSAVPLPAGLPLLLGGLGVLGLARRKRRG
ncbi:VPLPA-CTERM sorting domain-containing protein [Rhodobacteraceae bacterium F11138]|nr:VPLPA-CTERM sorting domain-containing protein [Rhodobacteraceae bacterium F11138]